MVLCFWVHPFSAAHCVDSYSCWMWFILHVGMPTIPLIHHKDWLTRSKMRHETCTNNLSSFELWYVSVVLSPHNSQSILHIHLNKLLFIKCNQQKIQQHTVMCCIFEQNQLQQTLQTRSSLPFKLPMNCFTFYRYKQSDLFVLVPVILSNKVTWIQQWMEGYWTNNTKMNVIRWRLAVSLQ